MKKQSKGVQTRKNIIDQVNKLYNRTEKILTLDELAGELNLTRSRITNYFPRKEQLILAIYEEYSKKLDKLIKTYNPDNEKLNLKSLVDYYSKIMDLLFEYRFAISYLFVNPLNDEELARHLEETYEENKNRLFNRIKILVVSGLVDKELLEQKNFDAFSFQHTNLLTTWVISYRIYDNKAGFKNMKPVYLRGVLNCYLPFMTESGKTDFLAHLENL